MRTLLIANRGEIARRINRTAQSLGYQTAAVFTEADQSLPYVREADVAVCIGKGPVDASYLNPEVLLEAAQQCHADMVHPGYGFLSENADFAQKVTDAGLTWVGPSPEAIRAVGDKARARQLAISQGIVVLPGYEGPDFSHEAMLRVAEEIGYPVLVKAVAGGGGRGMRVVREASGLSEALESASREAHAAFADGRILLERCLDRPRHIEVQVFADVHGTVLHLGERECSIQRRYQKIIEEAPSPAVPPELRRRLGEAATQLARAVGYTGAGTVEFLLDEDGHFFFLEMNARLQVEHPVTELVTGLDLVALQLEVAEGRALSLSQEDVTFQGHAIEARIYAEDPMRDWMPSTGSLLRFHVPESDGIRVDSGVETGSPISPYTDAMVAKVMAWGPTRLVATRRLERALGRTWMPGPASNLPLLRQVLALPAWKAGELDTGFLVRHGLPSAPPLNLEEGAIIATAFGWAQRRERSSWASHVPMGWRVQGTVESEHVWLSFGHVVPIRWRALGRNTLRVHHKTDRIVRVLELTGDLLRLEVDGLQFVARVAVQSASGQPHQELQDGDTVFVHFGTGEAMLTLQPRFPEPLGDEADPGTCVAPTPGTVLQINVAPGDAVEAGQTLVVLEAMKMEHHITAVESAVVERVCVDVGEAVDQGHILIRMGESG